MTELHKHFDWLAFLVRIVGVATFATLWLADSVHRRSRIGAIAAVSIGYVILPVLAYLYTRYYNSKFMVGFVEAVRRKIGGRTQGRWPRQ
jgi:hypothetical protein